MTTAAIPTSSPAHRFALTTNRTLNRLSIRVQGELVGKSAHHLEETLVLMAGSNDDIRVDLSEVTRIDREGLEVLLRSGSHADALDARITLEGLSTRFRRLLELCDWPSPATDSDETGVLDMSFRRGSPR